METPLFRARTAAVNIRTALKRKPLRGANSDSIPTPHGDTPRQWPPATAWHSAWPAMTALRNLHLSSQKLLVCGPHPQARETGEQGWTERQTLQLLMPRSHPALCSEGGRDHGL